MAILVSPGTSVTIIDETFYVPAQATTVPVIFGVTADRKFQANGTDPALGTYESNVLRAVTSIGQSLSLYGIPKFYSDSLGNPQHGDCRNEVGLATLNYFLGIGSLAYFIRANVNTDDSRASLLAIWTDLIGDAASKVQADAAAKLASINAANGWTSSSPNYRTTLTVAELQPIIQNALDTLVFTSYAFRTKSGDPTPTVWSASPGTYTTGSYVYHTGSYYKALTSAVGTDVPGAAPSVWQLQNIVWKNTPSLFMNDHTTMPLNVYGGPSGFAGAATGTYIGVVGALLDWEANGSGSVVGHEDEFTALEAHDLLISMGDDFSFTVEFNTSTSLGADDAARRAAIVTALQASTQQVQALRSDAIEFTLLIAPGFAELADDLNLLNSDTREEAVAITDGPQTMDPSEYVTWANSATPVYSGAPVRQRGSNVYYYGSAMITNVDGADIVVPNSTIALRTIAYSDLISYPWMAPAGVTNGIVSGVTRIGYIDGTLGEATTFVDTPLTQGERDQLYQAGINAIPFIHGSGYLVFSQQNSATVVSELQSINVDRLMKYIKRGLRKASKAFLFKPNDQYTRDQFKSFVDGFLSELVTLRGLFDFATLCDKSNNTPERIAKKELWCEVAVQPITAVEFIYIPITVQKPA